MSSSKRSVICNHKFLVVVIVVVKLPFLPLGLAGIGFAIFNAVPFSFMLVVGSLLLLLFDTTTLLLIFLFELLFLLLILCPATTDAIRSLVVDELFLLITGGVVIVWIFCIFANLPQIKNNSQINKITIPFHSRILKRTRTKTRDRPQID